jgi:hypothetical protein
MNGYKSYQASKFVFAFGTLMLTILAAIVSSAVFVWKKLALEARYRVNFGKTWQAEFEKHHGSLADSHLRIAIAGIGMVVIPLVAFYLYKALRAELQPSQSARAPRKRKQQRRVSRIERVVRYRRNAVWANFYGVSGIVAGVMLVVFRFGFFEDHKNEIILGLSVFITGFCLVVSGCWYWLKAKAWSGAVVFIAFMPLAVLFIPFVRLLFLVNLAIPLVCMVMSPLILVVVVFALPDHSNIPRSPISWDKYNSNEIGDE